MSAEPRPTPILRVIAGPTAGCLYPLRGRVVQIGRSRDSDILLTSKYVSGRHAEIKRVGEAYYLRDTASTAGVHIGGQKLAGPVRLEDGTRFRICDTEFRFHRDAAALGRGEAEATVHATLDPSSSGGEGAGARAEETLRAVLEIIRGLGPALELDQVLERAVRALFRVFPRAERGSIFEAAAPGGTPIPRIVVARSGAAAEPMACRAVLDHVLGRRDAVLCLDVAEAFPDSVSAAGLPLRSLVCVPLIGADGTPLGALQLDGGSRRGPFQQADLELLAAVAGPIGVALDNARLHATALRELKHQVELAHAERVMRSLLPGCRFDAPGYAHWSFYRPASHVGGDYLGLFPRTRPGAAPGDAPRRFAAGVGDVMGKGLPAALALARLATELRVALEGDADPAGVLDRLNRQLLADGPPEQFVTFALAEVDTAAHRLVAAAAGHLEPLLRRARTGEVERVGRRQGGIPLGLDDADPYRAAAVDLEPGDVAVLCTDGVYEALDAHSIPFGLDRLEAAIRGAGGGPAAVGEAILDALCRHAGTLPRDDDLTLLCIGRSP